jgi:hypothetical protein
VAETPKHPLPDGRGSADRGSVDRGSVAGGSLEPERAMSDSDSRLAARLKQLLQKPGISDKDRKLLERNLQRLLSAHEAR